MDCSYVRQLRRFGLRVSQAPHQNRVTCFVISALACTLARPAATLALLSHMLMNGFFFSHGLATGALPAEIFECKRSSGANGRNQTATTGDGTGAKQVVYRSSPGQHRFPANAVLQPDTVQEGGTEATVVSHQMLPQHRDDVI